MSFSLWTLALQAINFLALVWLLQRFLYRPVLDVLARRKTLAEQAFHDADAARAAAESERQRFLDGQAELTQARQALLQKTHAELDAEQKQMRATAQEEAQRIVADARAEVEAMRAAALEELQGQIGTLAAELAAAVLTAIGDDSPRLVESAFAVLLDRLDGLAESERARLVAEGGTLTVVTAADLDEERRSRWSAALKARLGVELVPEFAVDSALVGGVELRFAHALLSASWRELIDQGRARLAAAPTEAQGGHDAERHQAPA